MKSERDKFLTEQMGELYVEINNNGFYRWCNNFSTWEGFGKLWEWVRSTGNYDIDQSLQEISRQDADCFFIIDPDKFANFVYFFLKENDK